MKSFTYQGSGPKELYKGSVHTQGGLNAYGMNLCFILFCLNVLNRDHELCNIRIRHLHRSERLSLRIWD